MCCLNCENLILSSYLPIVQQPNNCSPCVPSLLIFFVLVSSQKDLAFVMNRSLEGWRTWYTEPMPNIGEHRAVRLLVLLLLLLSPMHALFDFTLQESCCAEETTRWSKCLTLRGTGTRYVYSPLLELLADLKVTTLRKTLLFSHVCCKFSVN